jgi:hypothetical protein
MLLHAVNCGLDDIATALVEAKADFNTREVMPELLMVSRVRARGHSLLKF